MREGEGVGRYDKNASNLTLVDDENLYILLLVLSLPLISLPPSLPLFFPPSFSTQFPYSPTFLFLPRPILSGLPYAAVESDIRTFLHGFNVQSLLVPMAPDNTKRAGKRRREGGRED